MATLIISRRFLRHFDEHAAGKRVFDVLQQNE